MIQVAIAAPAPVTRAGLRAMLAGGEVQVVAEGASLGEISTDLSELDVLLIASEDLLEETLRSAVGENAPAIVVLSEGERAANVLRSLPLRGWALLPPDTAATDLLSAVVAAAQGLVVLSPPVAERLLGPRAAVQTLEGDPLNEPLTGRELEVLGLISQGLPNKLIARRLGISEHTVKFHVSSIYTKLGAASRTEAVSLGARHGLVTL